MTYSSFKLLFSNMKITSGGVMKKTFIAIFFIILLIQCTTVNAVSLDTEIMVQKVEIIVDSYSFSPDTITVEPDKPVEITLRSIASTIPHDFTIDDPKSGVSISYDVKGGRDATFTFTPETPGIYKFYCSKKGLFGASHEEKGMVGTLVVQ